MACRTAIMVMMSVVCASAMAGATDSQERRVAPQAQPAAMDASDAAVVHVARASRVRGGSCDVDLVLDGQPVLSLASGQSAEFKASEGRHTVKAYFGMNPQCASSRVTTLHVDVRAGEPVRLVYDIAFTGQHLLRQAK